LVAQIALDAVMPRVDALDGRHPPRVVDRARKLREPGPHAVGRAFRDPQPQLRLALHRVLPAVRVLDADAEDPADRLPPERGAVLLRGLAVRPERRRSRSALAIGEQDVGNLAHGFHVERTERAAARVRDEPRAGIDGANLAAPQPPQLEQPILLPREVRAPSRVAWVRRARQRQAPRRAEVALAVLAVAHARSGPAVAED